jgi:hypothetical protein
VGCLYFKPFVGDIRRTKDPVKRIASILLLVLFAAGCATSTVDKRKQERSSAYTSLAPEFRALVDQAQIKVGMPMDAVYIAWGKPSQILTGESSSGTTTTWIYSGTAWQEHRYWNYRYYPGGRYYGYPQPYLDYDYVPLTYTAAEVVFENGVVKSWRNITPPQPY